MSNAYRTILIDPLRSLIRSITPCSSPLFSIRDQRSFIKAFIRYRSFAFSKNVISLAELGSILDPRIIGNGLWFRQWSKWLRGRIQRYIQSTATREDLVENGPYISPMDIASLRPEIGLIHKKLLESVMSFRRTIGFVYFKFPKHYLEPSAVAGLEFQKRRLECHTPGKWGKYEIRCDGNGKEFASFIKNRETRELLYKSYYGVFDDVDFNETILDLLRTRKIYANSLGFESWTEMQSVMNGLSGGEFSGLNFIDFMFSEGDADLRRLISKLKSLPICTGAIRKSLSTTDEQFFLTEYRLQNLPSNETSVATRKRESVFCYQRTIPKVMNILGDLFGVDFEPVDHGVFVEGWHPSVRIFRVSDRMSSGQNVGYVYLDLWGRGSGGMPPHCTVLKPQNHVRVYMGFHPPFLSDVTFKKERNFTFEEISALMHELGHCMHLLLRPAGSPISQLPLDMRETVSIVTEMYCETDEFLDKLVGSQVSANERKALKRNEYFYIDIIRNVAVSEYIHSSKFEPETASVDDLKRIVRGVYQKYSPIPLADYVNPLGGELSNYMIDGESRVGYLMSYVRAASILSDVKLGNCTGAQVFQKVRKQFIEKPFAPIVSDLLESRTRGIRDTEVVHPLPPILKNKAEDGGNIFASCNPKSLWAFTNLKP